MTIVLTDGADLHTGTDEAERVFGEGGNDTLSGGDGKDTLYGGVGNDSLEGGPGTDFYWPGSGNDTINAGPAEEGQFDVVVYSDLDSEPIHADMAAGTVTRASGTDTLIGISAVYGGNASDLFEGSDRDEYFLPEASFFRADDPLRELATYFSNNSGSDTIHGGGGRDVLSYTNSSGSISANWATGRVVDAEGNTDVFTEIEDFRGSVFNDTIFGNADDNVTNAFGGNDLIILQDGNDTAFGGDGDDRIWAGGNDTGDDLVNGGAGRDLIAGGPGNDELHGGTFADTLYGGPGDDILDTVNDLSEQSQDRAWGGPGSDVIYGTGGHNALGGGSGDDTIYGNGGSDTIFGGAGNDVLYSSSGANLIFAAVGNDSVSGGTGRDTIYGGAGDDDLIGQADNDLLYGGAGNDTLNMVDGEDTATGGAGADTYHFYIYNVDPGEPVTNSNHVITDFDPTEDTLRLTPFDIENFNDVFAAAQSVSGGVMLSFDGIDDNGNAHPITVTLEGVSLAALVGDLDWLV